MPVGLVTKKLGVREKQLSPAQFLRLSAAEFAAVSPGHVFRREMESYLAKHSIQKSVVVESNVFASVTRSIIDGVCIGFVPLPYIYRELIDRRLVVVGPRKLWDHVLYLYTRTGGSAVDLKNRLDAVLAIFIWACRG